ncbi:MAG: glycosyltransferase WbuB [Pirellulaceae bacterium]|nr:MAG: glycosyltransferase WbuB [Pirellulaceae bacterium]
MRVCIVSQYFWPESFLINDLAADLTRRGHQVHVLTGIPNYPKGAFYPGYRNWPKCEDFQGISIHRVPLVARGRGGPWRLAANYLSFAASATVIGPWLVRTRPDVLVVFQPSPATVGIPAAWLSLLRQTPLVYWVQDLWPDTLQTAGGVRSRWVLAAIDWMVRAVYRRCARVCVQSRGFASYVAAQNVPSHKIVIMPNWADDAYRPIDLPPSAPEHVELPSGFRLVYGGNVGQAQGWRTWVEAAERTRHLEHLKWVVIGEGRQWGRLRQEIEQRGLSGTVHLLGSRPSEAMPRYFAAADALLVSLKSCPVLARTIPSKVQAYLACGRPILAALEGDGAEVVRQAGAGLVVPPEDPQALADAAIRLTQLAPGERAAMGTQGRLYYDRHFARQTILDRWERLLEEVACQRRQSKECERCAA